MGVAVSAENAENYWLYSEFDVGWHWLSNPQSCGVAVARKDQRKAVFMKIQNLKFKIISIIILLLIALGLCAFLLSDENILIFKGIFSTDDITREEVQEQLSELGIRGYVTIVVLSMLQVVVAFLPAEPVQVIAGISFGFPIGLLCCTVGVLLGNTVIYVLYKLYGDKLREFFVKNIHLNFDKMATSKSLTLIIFILYFLPAIPYGMICFFAASFGMKFPRYITVTLLGAIPSVCIGVGLGHAAIASSLAVSITICTLLFIIIGTVMIKRDAIFKKVNEFIDGTQDGRFKVKKYARIKLSIAYIISRIVFFLRGVRVKYTKKVDGIETPSIVLSTHGSFIDFAYAGSLTKEKTPNFIVARLYFYRTVVGSFIREFGCFPKSMFTGDLESARNCLAVIKNGGVLAMMPEARLSTNGRFEDIQPGTYDFLKKCGVTVYTVSIRGNYLASPKWGDGLRRGSRVEAELDILFTKEELSALSAEQIAKRCEERLYYDDLEWLKSRPEIRYKRKTLAEGLENILIKCPKCKHKYTLRTKNRDLFCEKCGRLATLDDRYLFDTGADFPSFAEWYDGQVEEIRREILENENYSLKSRVTFKLPSSDGCSMLRYAGNGVCTLDRTGLTYEGTRDGEEVTLRFPIKNIYRLLFGAGESFEVYVGRVIHFFVPEERRSAVEWYIASKILYDISPE